MQTYTNRRTQAVYHSKSEEIQEFVEDSGLRYKFLKGGEGSGTTTNCVIKMLEKLRQGMNGILLVESFPHLRKDVFRVLQDWCPKDWVTTKSQYKLDPDWQPSSNSFQIDFNTVTGGVSSLFFLSGKRRDDVYGPSVNFGFMDSGHRFPDEAAFKALDTVCRITGPNREPPELFLSGLPRKYVDGVTLHWLYRYFGPRGILPGSKVYSLHVQENESLDPGYYDARVQALSEEDKRYYLDGNW